MNPKRNARYFFSQDGDSHWYMIPVELADEWVQINDVEDAWELPEWQKFEDCRLSGGPHGITFQNPIES